MKKYLLFLTVTITVIATLIAFTKKQNADKAGLGRLLFSDPILSKDSSISCTSCHKPAFAFADTGAVSIGVAGKKGSRNTPSAMNLSLQHFFFWDGRAKTLEEQALAPISNPTEMNLQVKEAVQRLRANTLYRNYFKEIFNNEPDAVNLAAAIASFERSLETSESPFDKWKFSDSPNAVNDDVKKGFIVFNEKGKCIKCHFGADFTSNEFRNIGLFKGKSLRDSGRAAISKNANDMGKFKIPSLRNVAITSPYMHNGMFKTLKEVIDFYNEPGKIVTDAINRDSLLMQPLGLNEQEKKDLETFLFSLTDKRFNITGMNNR